MIVKYPHLKKLSVLKISEDQRQTLKQDYSLFRNDFVASVKDNDLSATATIMDAYMNSAKEKEGQPGLTDKTKFYSSILEEIPVLLIEQKVKDLFKNAQIKDKLVLGDQVCLIRQCISPDLRTVFETKSIDFCLAAAMNDNKNIYIPLFGLEVKKYVDKTMFTTVMDTVKSLSYLRPRTKYGILMEEESRSRDCVANSPIYEDEFVLSGKWRSGNGRAQTKPEVLNALQDKLNQWTLATYHGIKNL